MANEITFPDNAQSWALERTPWDIIEIINSYLEPDDLCKLIRVCKGTYQLLQPLVWRRPYLRSLGDLQMFTNFLARPPLYQPVVLKAWDNIVWERTRQLQRLEIKIDPAMEGFDEIAINKMQRIVKMCPNVQITLALGSCEWRDVFTYSPHTCFPRTTLLNVEIRPLKQTENTNEKIEEFEDLVKRLHPEYSVVRFPDNHSDLILNVLPP